VRSVLVCVKTPVAAQAIATSAARLGMGSAVRTALSAGDALAQLATAPADLVLADTALSRPDSAEFTRRVLAVAPDTVLVLFGPEEPRIAAAAVRAGARGVIRGDAGDPLTVVTKALLLLLGPVAVGTAPMPSGPVASRAAPVHRTTAQVPQRSPAVPQQRGDAMAEPPRRRVDLTERELQVLRGMADGKSNAEIGRELFVSEDTVKTHARRLFRKLGARDRAHAVASAFRAGLVS
jgi:DNA-binding NarL/FixJ family response regulator